MAVETSHEADVAALEKLAAELTGRGFETRLAVPQGHVPSLAITNPQATALSETVVAGEDWYWWSWAEKVAAGCRCQRGGRCYRPRAVYRI
jgi:hypothetical protein